MKLINVLMVMACAFVFCVVLGALTGGGEVLLWLSVALALSVIQVSLILASPQAAKVCSPVILSLACLMWFSGCGSGQNPGDNSASSVNTNDQNVVININDPSCELDEVVDCDQFVVNLTCNGNLAGARAATCDECPTNEACAAPTTEG